MLANGTWHRGPFEKLIEHFQLVDTICSNKNGAGAGKLGPSPWGWYIYGGAAQDRNYWTNYGCKYPMIGGYGWSLVG